MNLAIVHSRARSGIRAPEVRVEVHLGGGLPAMGIVGLPEAAVREATRVGLEAVCARGRDAGVMAISAGNYGGKLGQFHFHLREILS